MAFKLQYNPSTNKIHYSAATNKVQVVDTSITPGEDCNNCDNVTPLTIRLTVSNATSLSGCTDCDLALKSDRVYVNVPDLNGSYILTQIGNPCLWQLIKSFPTFSRTTYNSTDGTCTGASIKHTYTGIYFIVQALSNSIRVTIEADYGEFINDNIILGNVPEASSGCVGIENEQMYSLFADQSCEFLGSDGAIISIEEL